MKNMRIKDLNFGDDKRCTCNFEVVSDANELNTIT
ncbi:hypothetical protein SAMN04487901_11319 [Prevotella communis]|uniref:Uncharacterized protein n=1 Tax=Prevotella communis TaxID=2913614 RepID=A0A1G7YAP7_9BACT|nr:hypothetical protein SAMN04487901_11319 [Prevotella communis]